MKTCSLIVLIVGCLAGCGRSVMAPQVDNITALNQPAQSAVPLQFRQEILLNTVVPPDCIGEYVDLSGRMNLTMTMVSRDDQTHIEVHANAMNALGVGQMTGNRYRYTGAITTQYGLSEDRTTIMVNSHFKMSGPGDGMLVYWRVKAHLFIGADGSQRVLFEEATAGCGK